MSEEFEVSFEGEHLEVQTYTTWQLSGILFTLFRFLFVIELALQVIWLAFGETR